MVTALEPVARQAAVRPLEVRSGEAAGNVPSTAPVRATVPDLEAGPAGVRTEKADSPQVRSNFLARVTGSLGAVGRALSGTPMTDRERNRRAINEANCRHSAALVWSQRINW